MQTPKRALKICATLITLAFAFYFLSLGFMRGETYDRYQTFIRSETDYDVVFLGTSHVLNGVNPMQLWEDYGIAGYNLAYHSANIPINFWQAQLANGYHKPKIIMIDMFTLWSKYMEDKGDIAAMHNVFDIFPLFPTKLRAALDLLTMPERRAELAFPFYSYHNRWKDAHFKFRIKATLKRLLGKYKPYVTKGMDFRIAIKANEFSAPDFEIKTRYDGTETTSMAYCRKFIAYCKENDIVPVFIFVPYFGAVSTQESRENLATWFSAMRSIVEEEGGFFLDMSDGIVDFDIDMYDLGSHLNPSGARKVTDAIGTFLSERLGCHSHKDDAAFTSWHDDYAAYRAWLLGTIERQKDFKNLLMMANHAEVYAIVTAAGDATFDSTEEKLLFGNWSDIRFTRTAEPGAKVNVAVYERGTDKEVVRREFEKPPAVHSGD